MLWLSFFLCWQFSVPKGRIRIQIRIRQINLDPGLRQWFWCTCICVQNQILRFDMLYSCKRQIYADLFRSNAFWSESRDLKRIRPIECIVMPISNTALKLTVRRLAVLVPVTNCTKVLCCITCIYLQQVYIFKMKLNVQN